MMTRAEKDAAIGEYDALPGTPADLTRVIDISGLRGTQPDFIAKHIMPIADELRPTYKWFRVTAPDDDEDNVYFEAWLEKPYKQGQLNRAVAQRVNGRGEQS